MISKFCLVTIFAWSAFSHAVVEVDKFGATKTTTKIADSGSEMRTQRRAGVGLVAGGVTAMIGVNLEVNFTEHFGVHGGFGTSDDFQSFFIGAKQIFGGESLMPYASYGYARWFATGRESAMSNSTPEFFAKKFLSDDERARGIFSENLAFGGFGLQYVQLDGDWAGASVYIEALLLMDIDDIIVLPTLGTGLIYYF